MVAATDRRAGAERRGRHAALRYRSLAQKGGAVSGTARLRRAGQRGFTLLEALIAVALMSAIVSMLAAVTAQWMPSWRRGFERVQSTQLLGLGLQRATADLAAAEFVAPNGQALSPLFIGNESSVILVRRSIGPGAAPQLEAIRLSQINGPTGFSLVRERAPFNPIQAGAPIDVQLHFADPVTLVRAPYRISFSYAGLDRVWQTAWRDLPLLPAAVRIVVRDAATEQILSVSVATSIYVSASADCVRQKTVNDCASGPAIDIAPEAPAQPPSAPQQSGNGSLQ